ncbi:hypothetical protein [Rhodococcus erythropolis]
MDEIERVTGKTMALVLIEDVITKLENTERAQYSLHSARRLRRWISEEVA